jgi:hypothetical protein
MTDTADSLSTHDLVEFTLEHGGDCFRRWTLTEIRQWFAHHNHSGNLIYVTDQAQRLVAYSVGWQMESADIPADVHQVDHYPVGPQTGDAYYISQLVCIHPAGFSGLLAGWQRRWPEWSRLKVHAHRRQRGKRKGASKLTVVPFTEMARMPYFARSWRDGALKIQAFAA